MNGNAHSLRMNGHATVSSSHEHGSSSSSTRSAGGIKLTHLLHAAGQGNVEAIREILEDGHVTVNQADYDGRTAMHLACSEGRVDAVKALLELGADANPKDRYGNTPLADAQSYGSAEIVRLLKQKGGFVSESFHAMSGRRPQIKGLDEFEIELSDLDMASSTLIGKGIFGEVRKAKWRGTPVAVKVFQDSVGKDKKTEEEFKEELRILQTLRHPNVVQFLGAVTRSQPHLLVTEYLSKGNLHQILRRKGSLSADEALRYALDIARGMNYLHQHKPEPLVHRDLSPYNLLRDEAGHLKVADFGLSRIRVEARSLYLTEESGHGNSIPILNLSGSQSSYRFMAPEVFASENVELMPSMDVYSFGVILFEMFEGLQKPKYRADEAALKYWEDTSRPTFHSIRYPPNMKELISKCWAHDPDARPTFQTILSQLEGMGKGQEEAKPKPKCCTIL